MAMFFGTQAPPPEGYPDVKPYWFPVVGSTVKGDVGVVFVVAQDLIQDSSATKPPIPPYSTTDIFRFYLCPIRVAGVTNCYGICSQWIGRRFWVMAQPSTPNYPLRYMEADFPPAAPGGLHPALWLLTPDSSSTSFTMYNALYSRYVKATPNWGFRLVAAADFDNQLCRFLPYPETSCGPVLPTPIGETAVDDASYVIMTSQGKALTASLTPPYLSQAPVDFNSPAQKFYFRAVRTPTVVQPNFPFTYNMYFRLDEATMLCIEDNGSLGIRTDAGIWEELSLVAPAPYFSPAADDTFGRVMIGSFEFGSRLRANADGSVAVAPLVYPETKDDFYNFLPVAGGSPFPRANPAAGLIAPMIPNPQIEDVRHQAVADAKPQKSVAAVPPSQYQRALSRGLLAFSIFTCGLIIAAVSFYLYHSAA